MGKGELTRQAILERATALASRSGLEGVSIGHLAEELGLSKSGLFAHFGSKEALQVEILRFAAERFVENVVRPALAQPRGEPRVRAIFERWIAWGRSQSVPGGCLFVAAASELDDRPGPARDELVRLQRDWLDSIAIAFRSGITEGHFRADCRSRAVRARPVRGGARTVTTRSACCATPPRTRGPGPPSRPCWRRPGGPPAAPTSRPSPRCGPHPSVASRPRRSA